MTITVVSPVNSDPIGITDTYTINENTILNATSVLSNDTDIDGDSLNVDINSVSTPSHGTVTFNNDGTFIYTPNANFFGVDTFTYTAIDNKGGLSSATTVTVNVTSTNVAPVAFADPYTMDEDDVLNGPSVLANDTDIDSGDTLTIDTSYVSSPSNGTLVLNSDGTFVYTPIANYYGTDSFSYRVLDNEGLSSTATVTITIINDGLLGEVIGGVGGIIGGLL